MGSIENIFAASLGSVTGGFDLAIETISKIVAEGFGSLGNAAE